MITTFGASINVDFLFINFYGQLLVEVAVYVALLHVAFRDK